MTDSQTADSVSIQVLLQGFTERFTQRMAEGRPIVLEDLADRTKGELAAEVDSILVRMGLSRVCGTDTIWKVLYLIDHQIPNGRELIPESVRTWLLGPLWEALEAQERSVVSGLGSLLVVVQQACLAERQAALPESPESRARLIDQGNRARAQICAFVRRYPSLLTFGVQARLMDADDIDIAHAFVESLPGTPDFVTQQAIIATQNRLRAQGVLGPLRALAQAGMHAANILSEGMSAVMETVNNEIRGNLNAGVQQGQRIEAQVVTLQTELNTGPRTAINQLRGVIEQEIEANRPALYLALMRTGPLAPYMGGEIVTAETRLDREIVLLVQQLVVRRDQAESARTMVLQSLHEIFDQLKESQERELHRIEADVQRNRTGWEKDPHREEHYAAEIKRLQAVLLAQRTLYDQQAALRNNVEGRLNKLTSVPLSLLDRIISQIRSLHTRVRTHSHEVFQHVVKTPLASEKQVAIVEFGDRVLTLGLIANLRDKLSYDTQVLIAVSGDTGLHSALVTTLGDALVTAARRHISPELLVSSFDETTLVAGLHV